MRTCITHSPGTGFHSLPHSLKPFTVAAMSLQTIGTPARMLALKSAEGIRQALFHRSSRDEEIHCEGPRFKPFFDIYARDYVFPQQVLIREHNKPGQRGPNIDTVEVRMVAGESLGHDKFSNSHTDRSTWDQVDHAAALVCTNLLSTTVLNRSPGDWLLVQSCQRWPHLNLR